MQVCLLHPHDNVATALQHLSAGEVLQLRAVEVRIAQDILFGHKFAVRAMAPGDSVYKYGEVIGVATIHVSPGEHVHTHNIRSLRGGALG